MRKDLEQRGTESVSPCSWSPTQTVSPTRSTHLWAMARRVKPSTGRLAKQLPRSRRSLTHSRGGKRRSSLLGGVQSWYTLCRTSSSKDRTSFSSASESPCLWKGGTDVGARRSRGRDRCDQLYGILPITEGLPMEISVWTVPTTS